MVASTLSEAIAKVRRMMERQPKPDSIREQLFWLVDVIYACKGSGHQQLVAYAALVEQAVGALGQYLQDGDEAQLQAAGDSVAAFAQQLAQAFDGESSAQGEKAGIEQVEVNVGDDDDMARDVVEKP